MRYILLILSVLFFTNLTAQYAYFPTEGTITYDKTFHVKNLMRRHLSTLKEGDFQRQMFEQLMDKAPDTFVAHQKLKFKGEKYSYEHVDEDYPPLIQNLMNWGVLGYEVTSYTDLEEGKYSGYFDLAGTPILLEDSLLNVKWKITNEYREIAGYECRRANGIMLDSVYVVAFYTDQIPVSAGPGAVHGLPGAMLGFIVPELHYNIYASKIDVSPVTVKKDLGQKKRDEPQTRKEFYERLKKTIGSYLEERQYNLVMSMIFL